MASQDSWFKIHTVTWTRKIRGTRVGINDAPLTDAINFPKTITGDLQEQSGNRTIQIRGVEVTINATFFTAQSGIVVNDRITLNGKTYVVQAAIPRTGPGGKVDHYECTLIYET